MKRGFILAIIGVLFFQSCARKPQNVLGKELNVKNDVVVEYEKTLNTPCRLTVEKALDYLYNLTEDDAYLYEKKELPRQCLELNILKNSFVVGSLAEKEKKCFSGIDLKNTDKLKLTRQLKRLIYRTLLKNNCI